MPEPRPLSPAAVMPLQSGPAEGRAEMAAQTATPGVIPSLVEARAVPIREEEATEAPAGGRAATLQLRAGTGPPAKASMAPAPRDRSPAAAAEPAVLAAALKAAWVQRAPSAAQR